MSRPARTLHELVDRAPPDRPAVLAAGGGVTTFGDLAEASNRAASGLRALGVARGTRVGIYLPNLPEWLVLALACARLGAVAVAINTRFRGREVGDIVRRARCAVLAMAPGYRGGAHGEALRQADPASLSGLRALVAVGGAAAAGASPAGIPVTAYADLAAGGDRAPVRDGRPDDPVAIFTTSGTTSAPKLVLHGQGRVAGHAADVARAFGLEAEDTVGMVAVPLCGVFGFSLVVPLLHAARPMVLMEAFAAAEAVALAREHRATTMIGTNEMLDHMLDASPEPRPLPSLRFFGHANFNPALVELPRKAESRGVLLRGLFGMSETLALFAAQPADAPLERRALAGGLPVSVDARVRAADPDTGEVLAAGEPGEIQVAAPSLMLGYDGDEAATAAAFTPDGYFRTGDLGYATEDGGFVHLTRMGDALRIGGYLVNPAEIEDVLLQDPSVAAAQVVEVARREGVRPVAFVVPAAPGHPVDEAALIARCRSGLAVFKAPVAVFAIGEMPTAEGPNGVKVRRGELRRMAAARLAERDAAGQQQGRATP
jgi:fatty-acyl-CoA synthase